jgi:hypothetical protein
MILSVTLQLENPLDCTPIIERVNRFEATSKLMSKLHVAKDMPLPLFLFLHRRENYLLH